MRVTFEDLSLTELNLIKTALEEKIVKDTQNRSSGYETRRHEVTAIQDLLKKIR
jgi:hypothetical protein